MFKPCCLKKIRKRKSGKDQIPDVWTPPVSPLSLLSHSGHRVHGPGAMRLPCRPTPNRCLLQHRRKEGTLPTRPLSLRFLPHLLPCLRSLCLASPRDLATVAAARRAPCRRSRASHPDRSLPEGSPRRSLTPCRRNRWTKASSADAARIRPRLRLTLGVRFRGECRGLRPPGPEQIGRAACRERVYVLV